MRIPQSVTVLGLSACLGLGLMVGAWACNVPVFRYALDHWLADTYQAVVIHQGPLSVEEQSHLDQLRSLMSAGQCNLQVRTIDAAGQLSASDQNYLTRHQDMLSGKGAHLLLHYPESVGSPTPVLAGELNQSFLTRLVDSPVRQELVGRLCAGQSAVWILVQSGDRQQDEPTVELIEHELRKLQATLELPKLTDAPEDAVVGGPALRVELTLLKLNRDDPQEQELVAMLLNSEPDLLDAPQPVLFATFGRARVLWPLVGAGITSENLSEMAHFVVGACSCQVKEQNPGFDLLVKADWRKLLPWTENLPQPGLGGESEEVELVPLPGGTERVSGLEMESQIHEPGTPAEGRSGYSDSRLRMGVSALTALTALLLGGGLLIGLLAILRSQR